MANLFPIGSLESVTLKNNEVIEFKGTYAIDLKTGEFITNPDGTIKITDKLEGYIQWCEKAILTTRYKYRAYSNKYGKDIIGSNLDHKAVELEIERVIQEALMVHPMTSGVGNFIFTWGNGEVYYSYEVTTIYGQTKVLTSKDKVG